jgi:glycosyltransferase involved in cell wall biosynthesis
MALTVLYLGIFAFLSLFAKDADMPKAKKENRFVVIVTSHKSGKSLERTVKSVLGQSYAQRLFDITVVADHEDEMTMFHLAQQPITLLTPTFERSTRTKCLQLAVNNLPQFKIYDAVVLLDAGDVVEPEFLEQMNMAYEAARTKAVQAHKLSLNRDTTSARLSAVFEEINNSIFRRGHIAVGMPAAIASSGIIFEFNWFKNYILSARPSWGDKELEFSLLRQHIHVDYFDQIFVYNEKVRQAEDFNRQHRRNIMMQLRSILRNIRYMPIAMANRHYNLIDKLLQWILIPRMIMMMVIILMCVVVPFIYFTAALKWWALFAIVIFVFAIATPNYLVDDKWDSTFYKIPVVMFSSILNKYKLGRKLKDAVKLQQ